MGRLARRSAFAASVGAGLAMVAASVDGLLRVDAELQRTVARAQQQEQVRSNFFRASLPERRGECPAWAAVPRSRQPA